MYAPSRIGVFVLFYSNPPLDTLSPSRQVLLFCHCSGEKNTLLLLKDTHNLMKSGSSQLILLLKDTHNLMKSGSSQLTGI